LLFLLLLVLGYFTQLQLFGGQDVNHDAHQARAYRMAEPPNLDGRVNEPEWQKMEPVTGFIQQLPNEGRPATERTEVRIGFDDDNLYLGIICFDSEPANIVVTQNRRDGSLVDTDSIQILLDTFHDKHNGFIFGTSPTGIEYDAQVSKGGQGREGLGAPARAGGQGGSTTGTSSTAPTGSQLNAGALNLNWDGVWKVKSQITERGWESEIAIPFKTLRYWPGSGRSWGLNVTRNLRRRNEQSFWAPIGRNFTFTQVELAGELQGLELKPHHQLQLLPYVLAGWKQDHTVTPEPSQFARNAGLDVKYSLAPGLTLDATFNTDFAQVEVDDQQVNLTRFDLFFPEKRPFFLENAGTFEFGTPKEVELFFSRRIGIDASGIEIPIDAGLRLSGKVGRFDVGLLDMKTREVDGVAPSNNFSVLRVSREFGRRSSVGLIGVNRQSLTRNDQWRQFNRTYGADANIGLGRYLNWFSYAAKTETPGLSGGDRAYSTAVNYDDVHHRFDAGYLEVGNHFNPEVGFVKRVGFRKPFFGYRHTFYPEGTPLRSVFPHFQWNRWYTLGTNQKESGFEHYHLDTRWQNGSELGVAFNRNFERLDQPFEIFPGVRIAPGRYGYSEGVVNYATDPSAHYFASGNGSVGHFYGGTIRTVNVNGGYRPSGSLSWTGSYIRNFIHLPEGAFNTDLVGLRFNWSFTPKRYLQAFTQYNSRTSQLGTNIRLAILSTSSSGFFLVYNTRVATEDYFDPHEIQRRTLSRALFFKYSYLFDF
jgi:hypothetical protein